MKKVKILLSLCVIFIAMNVYAAGSVTISKESITINKGETAQFTIDGNNIAGKVDISSLSTATATIDQSSYFFDTSLNNSSLTVTVTGVAVGETKIKIALTDVATFDEEELTGNKYVNIVVVDPNASENNNQEGNNNNNEQNNTEPENNTGNEQNNTEPDNNTGNEQNNTEPENNTGNEQNNTEPENNTNQEETTSSEKIDNVPKTAVNVSLVIIGAALVCGIVGLSFVITSNIKKNDSNSI